MKKFVTLAVGAALVFQSAVAFAATAPATSNVPVIQKLLAMNKWFYADNFKGVRYVNDNLAQGFKNALSWDDHARLSLAHVEFSSDDVTNGSNYSCWFVFSSDNKPDTVYNYQCDWADGPSHHHMPPTQEVVDKEPGKTYESFDFPVVKLRKFVSDILAIKVALDKVRSLNYGDLPIDGKIHFELSSQGGVPTWEWYVEGLDGSVTIKESAIDMRAPLIVQ